MPDNEWGEKKLGKIRQLIGQLYAVVAELESEFGRKFTPDGHLVGSIGELVAAYSFGLQLLPASSAVHDAETAQGTLVQIKLTGGNRAVSLYSEPVHLIVLQVSSKQFQEIYNGPGAPVWAKCGPLQKNGQRTISLSALREINCSASPKVPQIRAFPALT